MNADLFALLLSTQALEIAPPLQPFWYTSGTIGPYYLNGHFLFGNRTKAEALLSFIDQNEADRPALLRALHARVTENYKADANYRAVIEAAVESAEQRIGSAPIDFVSGGERRDWFFSLMVARVLDKPALALFKDKAVFGAPASSDSFEEVTALAGAQILHVADLVTEASSYTKTWLPALQQRNGFLRWAINIVDRGQSGEAVLQDHGVAPFHLIQLGPVFFERLRQAGYLNEASAQLLTAYHQQPRETMKKLLQEHPEILHEALQSSDAKIRHRARQMLAENPYDLALPKENDPRALGAA